MTILSILKNTPLDHRETLEILACVLKQNTTHIIAHPLSILTPSLVRKTNFLIKRRHNGEPLAYLTGHQPFLDFDFKVNKHTLIPRPETEQLVLLVKQHLEELNMDRISKYELRTSNKGPVINGRDTIELSSTSYEIRATSSGKRGSKFEVRNSIIVDIGTGSGCIACSLKKYFPEATVVASDISKPALSVVKHNAKKLSTPIKLIHSNLLNKKLQEYIKKSSSIRNSSFVIRNLVLVANLPYLPYSDAPAMQKDVIKFEPHQALFSKENGNALIKKLLHQIASILNSKFLILNSVFLEINPPSAKELTGFAKKLFPNNKVEIIKDSNNLKRFLVIKQPSDL